jgi:hypothetical protein
VAANTTSIHFMHVSQQSIPRPSRGVDTARQLRKS